MGFADALKRLFNINTDDDAGETEISSATLLGDDPEATENVTAAAPEVAADSSLEIDPAMKTQIFEGVLTVFNATLPDFLRRSIDPEAQRQALADSLDSSIAQYLDSLAERADRRAAARLRSAADQAKAESERLRSRMEAVETEKSHLREQQLSADRRRRALDDRVRDLEGQLAKAEADGEQLRLENQSLVNKLKVADIQPAVIDELNARIKELTDENAGLRQQTGSDALDAANARIADFESGAELNKSMISQLESRLAEEARLRDEEARLKDEEAKLKEEALADLAKVRDELARTRTRLADAKAELDEASKIGEAVAKMQERIEGVQDVIRKRDEKIARLRAANKRLKDNLAEMEANFKNRMQVAPAGLFALDNDDTIDKIEDDFQCPEWFVSEPEPGTPIIKSELDDFGYQEPPKKPRPPENEAQLSLF